MSFAYRRRNMLSRRQPFPRYVRPLSLISSLNAYHGTLDFQYQIRWALPPTFRLLRVRHQQ